MTECPHCGAIVADGTNNCPSCGAPLSQQPQYDQQNQYNQQPQYGQQPQYNQYNQQPQYGQQNQYNQYNQQPYQGYNYSMPQYVQPVSTGGLIAWSIVTLLLCTIPGIVALIYATKINKATTVAEQEQTIKTTKTWCLVGTILGVLAIIGSIASSALQ